MKVDEVAKIPELSSVHQGDVARQGAVQKHNMEPPQPLDQANLSQAARFMSTANQAARTEQLKQSLARGVKVDAGQLAATLLRQGVVK